MRMVIAFRVVRGFAALLVALATAPAVAAPLQPDPYEWLQPVVGEDGSDLVIFGDTLLDLAFRNGVGYEALTTLNPDVDSWIPVPGTVVEVPSRAILPSAERKGLVINIPEMRLFDFTIEGGPEVISAAVGDLEDPTPIGNFLIRDKRTDPTWYVPKSIREEKPELPPQVAAGPDNPLGSRWMRIGDSGYGIHGTNTRWSIGREATHGCVRLYEEDVKRLFDRIPDGTPLQIVYQPYKWGRDGSQILFEAHPDRYHRIPDRLAAALAPIRDTGLFGHIDIERVWRAIDESRGVPVLVGKLPEAEAP
jgi:L,D-transpeptidase ErfK/SrfK